MPSRYINSDILLDGTIRKLTPAAFKLWVLLLAATDDFGIVKITPDDIEKLAENPLPHTSNGSKQKSVEVSGSELLREITENNFGKIIQFSGRLFFIFKPDSFDRYQFHLRNKRSISKCLGVPKEEVSQLRDELYSQVSLPLASTGTQSLPNTSLARATSNKQCNKQEILNNNSLNVCLNGKGGVGEKRKPGRPRKSEQAALVPSPPASQAVPHPPSPNGKAPDVADAAQASIPHPPSSIPKTIPDAVIAILHDIGHRTGIEEYQNISAFSWLPDLRRKGNEIGFQCLLKQTERFRQHMLADFEAGKLKGKKHNPRAKFMNTWLGRVYKTEFTTGDTEQQLQPAAPAPAEQPRAGEVTGL